MTELHDSQPDAIAVVVSGKLCHLVPPQNPTDYVENISWFLSSSVGQSRPDNEPTAEADSDSGDSLFITQKPVPQPVRSARRRSNKRRPAHKSTRRAGESDDYSDIDGSALSASHGEPEADKERRRKKYRLPKYSFPFLAERGWKSRGTLLPSQKNISLHNAGMGGFFKYVREMRPGHGKGGNAKESSLPTLDVVDGDVLSPLSEGEEEYPDIRVVERKCFLAPSKAKSKRSWCSQSKLKQQGRSEASNATPETSTGRQSNTLSKDPSKASILGFNTQISKDGGSCKGLVQVERNNARVTNEGIRLAHTKTPNVKRRLNLGNIHFPQEAREEEELSKHNRLQSPGPNTQQTGRRGSVTTPKPQRDVPLIDHVYQNDPESLDLFNSLPDDLTSDTNNNSVCDGSTVKKRKKKKKDKGDHRGVEGGMDQSLVEPEGLHDVAFVNEEEEEESPSLTRIKRPEPPLSQASNELELNEENCMVNLSHDDDTLIGEDGKSPSLSVKKKKKRKKFKAECIGEEVNGNLHSDVRTEDPVEQLESGAVCETPNDGASIKRKKHKRKKEDRTLVTDECEGGEAESGTSECPPVSIGQLEECGNCLEDTAAFREPLESSCVKKRKKHKKKKQQLLSNDEEEDGDDSVTFVKTTGVSVKKTKKQKTISDWVGYGLSNSPDENENVEKKVIDQETNEGLEEQTAEPVPKKKRKRKTSEISGEGRVAQSDDSASVREEEQKSTPSFLVADREGKECRTHTEHIQQPHSQTESAEFAGNLEGHNHAVRTKKRKRKSLEERDQEHGDFEEAGDTPRRKKKRAGNESEMVLLTPIERPDSEADDTTGVSTTKKKKKKKKEKCSDEPCYETNMVEQASPATETLGHDTPNDMTDEKKNKKMKSKMNVLPEGELMGDSAELEREVNKKKKKKKKTN